MKRLMNALGVLLCLALALPVQAQDLNPQMTEANQFFNKVLTETKNPVIAALVQESLSKLGGRTPAAVAPAPTRHQVEVPLLTQLNNGLAVPVLIEKKVTGTFIVDTGATYTVITPALARRLGVEITPDTPRLTIITANGPVSAPLVTVRSIAIGGLEVRDVKVLVHNLGNDVLLAGLLGMNFFKDMDLTIRQNKLILSISSNF